MHCFDYEARREAADGLTRECWRFAFDGDWRPTLYVSGYCRQERTSKRHRWRTLEPFFCNLSDPCRFKALPSSEVPLPADVRQEARDAFIAQLAFTISHPARADARKP